MKELKFNMFAYNGNCVTKLVGKKYAFIGNLDILLNELNKQTNEL